MRLELEALFNAVSSLEKAVRVYNIYKNNNDIDLIDILRSGVIQNFKVAFEQCWKFIARWLDDNIAAGVTSGITKKELFTLAAKHLLIKDVSEWMRFKEGRNFTSHTYSEITAEEVLKHSIEFLPHAKYLLQRLEKINQ